MTASASFRTELRPRFHPSVGFLQEPLSGLHNVGGGLPLSFPGSLQLLFDRFIWSGVQAMQYGITVLLKPTTKVRLYEVTDPRG